MQSTTDVDYIIVGQGLAGSAIAIQLIKRGKKVLVIDQPNENTSSRIAAGIFNPLTGRKLVKTWLADIIFPYLINFYQEAESLTDSKFFYNMPLYRPFFSVEEQNEWMGRSTETIYKGYLEKIFITNTMSGINDQFGGILLNQCGYVDTTVFTLSIRALIIKHGIFLEECFDESELYATDEGVHYKGYKAPKIIFCEGERVINSKWFGWVPIIPLKGETLTIQTSNQLQQIINHGVYIVPVGKNELRVGSTYDFNDVTRGITHQAGKELTGKLRELVNFPFRIVKQEWGMRPTTPDRRPIVGVHPSCKSVFILNGLGTKGVSLAPYFSEVLVNLMEDGTDLNREIDVNRYKSLYSKFTK